MDSRPDSLAARMKRENLFDEYFAWWLQTRPSIADRQEWLANNGVHTSVGAISRLHKSPEAGEWRFAEAARARASMDASLPQDIEEITRKALLDQRLNAVLSDLSHKELMDHFFVEHSKEMAQLKRDQLELKKQDKIKDSTIARLRLQVDRAKEQLRKVADEGLTDANKDGVAALLSELEALGVQS